jgi:hypothetical protein
MVTYHKQFERDFTKASQTVIDATEGGLAKEGTTAMPLAEALDKYATRPVPALPEPEHALDPDRLAELSKLLARRLDEVHELQRCARQSIPILRQMKKHQRNQAKMKKLFARLSEKQRYVETQLKSAFDAVSEINAIGGYRRARTDRVIERMTDDGFAKQAQRLDRDIENLQWLVKACDEARPTFEEARRRVDARLPTSTSAAEPVGV